MASILGVSPRTYSYYESGDRTPDAEALVHLTHEGWNANWLLTGEGPERLDQAATAREGVPSQELSGEHLMIATELADEALQGLWLPRPRYFELVALIYEALTQGLPYAEIIEFARPAAEKSARQGQNDDSEQGLDLSSSGSAGRRSADENG